MRTLRILLIGLVFVLKAAATDDVPIEVVVLGEETSDGRTLRYVVPSDKHAVLHFGSFSSLAGSGYYSINGKAMPPVSPLPLPAQTTVEIPTGKGFVAITLYALPKQPTTMTPSTAIVIPENATGTYRVALETSVDLVTWTETLPGLFGSSTSRRFFRTRIVQQ